MRKVRFAVLGGKLADREARLAKSDRLRIEAAAQQVAGFSPPVVKCGVGAAAASLPRTVHGQPGASSARIERGSPATTRS